MRKKLEWTYRCDHCFKPYRSQSHCKEHEKVCFSDPAHKTCYTCTHSGDPHTKCYCSDFNPETDAVKPFPKNNNFFKDCKKHVAREL